MVAKKKQLHPKHFFQLGIASFFLTGAILGAFFLQEMSNRNAFSNSLKIFKDGQMVSNSFYDVQVKSVSRGGGEPGSMPTSPDKQYVTLNIYIKNKSSKTLAFFPITQTYIKDETGKAYGVGAAVVKQQLLPGDIVSGDSTNGEMAYAIPKDLKNPRFYIEGLASKPVVIQLK